MNEWTREDDRRAKAEGWALFDCDGLVRLQKVDDPAADPENPLTEPVFESDAEAALFVRTRARAGSAFHADALELIRRLG